MTTPLPEDLDGSVGKVRGVVAGLDALLPSGGDGAPEGPFQAVGTVLAGLGAGALVAASLAWTVAGASALGLERDCPDHKCVEGTPGARTYRRVRDGARAADILVGVGMPVLTGGLLLVVLGSTAAPPPVAGASTTPDAVAGAGTLRVTPSVGATGGELVVEASF
ncbi:MAG: hypothetical protein IT373_31105 [Polyangiaceae bacterium]|nr:hypothetical protein [Polyangiaceae bacterium]